MNDFYKNTSSISIDTSMLYPLSDVIRKIESGFPSYELESIPRKQMVKSVELFLNPFQLSKVSIIKDNVNGRVKGNGIKVFRDSVFKVPVNFNLDEPTDGFVNQVVRNGNELLVESISLPSISTIFSASTYIHEIIHTQVNVYKGNIRYPFNDEVMTCLLEFLFLLSRYGDKQSFSADYHCRLGDIRRYIDIIREHEEGKNLLSDDEYDEYFANVVSFIQALGLLNLYRTHNITYRKNMLKRIQLVLSNKICVEDLLDYYNINLNTLLCEKSINVYKK